MSNASDKARFYLERYVPELQEYERKQIFTRDQITAIAAKRSDFEHILNARGSQPGDYARYATYEINLDSLRKKRCKRLGIKSTTFNGQRIVFFIMERGVKKFPGDMGLWMQYIKFCQQQESNKKLAKAFTSVLRLKPREWGLWVLAAKHYAETQGDMATARIYMQRGLRFCKDKKELYIEYMRLEMVYLAKLAARRRILGTERSNKGDPDEMEEQTQTEDENIMMLPKITAADFDSEAKKGTEEVDVNALERLASAPVYTGAISMAIFDAAMKQFNDRAEVAEDFFDLVVSFTDVPASKMILQNIVRHLQSSVPISPSAISCEARLALQGADALSAEFPVALGKALSVVKDGLERLPEKLHSDLAEKTSSMLLPYLISRSRLDEDITKVVIASLNRYLRCISPRHRARSTKTELSLVHEMASAVQTKGNLSASELLAVYTKRKTQASSEGMT
nr:u3 small nucleolar rna-associated protein 6 [Quercus suber]